MSTDLKIDCRKPEVGVGEYQFGFHDPTDKYAFTSPQGARSRIVAQISEMKNEPAWMREFRLQVATSIFESKPMPNWGGDMSGTRLPEHLLLRQGVRPAGEDLGRRSRRHPQDLRPARHPRSREEVPLRREGPVRVRSRLRLACRKTSPSRGCSSPTPTRPCKTHPELFREYFGTIIPSERQQVRGAQLGRLVGRLVHLRPAGGEDRVPAAGLLPHQHREHGPVRADADHRRRRGQRALRRRLHGPDVHPASRCTRRSSRSSSSANGRCRYTTIQNWSNNVYNLVTKRAMAYGDSLMEWIDGNLGSKLTMKYPAV